MSARTGLPVRTVRARRGRARRASANASATVRAGRAKVRFASPGTAFCSCRTTGRRERNEARTTGTLTYPPIPTTTSAASTRGRTALTDRTAATGAVTALTETLRSSGRASTATSSNPASATRRPSCPPDVPAKRTS